MTEVDWVSRAETRRAPEGPAAALSAVVDDAAALAKAEVRLAVAEAKAWLVRLGLGLVLLWLLLSFLQVLMLLAALSPLALVHHSISRVALMLAIALVPTLCVGLLAWRELGRAKVAHHDHDEPIHAERHS